MPNIGIVILLTFTHECMNAKKKKKKKEEERMKEGNVLFNDTLNTFYLLLYGIRHMVKDHSDSERGNPLQPHGLVFPISSILLYAPSHRQDSTYHGLYCTRRRRGRRRRKEEKKKKKDGVNHNGI